LSQYITTTGVFIQGLEAKMKLVYETTVSWRGFNINIPLTIDKMTDEHYLQIFDEIIIPALTQFDPELIVVSSGFDAVVCDSLGVMIVTPECYGEMTAKLMKVCPKIVVVLEGGYNLKKIAECSTHVTRALLTGEFSKTKLTVRERTELNKTMKYEKNQERDRDRALKEIIHGVKLIQKKYYPCFSQVNVKHKKQKKTKSKNLKPRNPKEKSEVEVGKESDEILALKSLDTNNNTDNPKATFLVEVEEDDTKLLTKVESTQDAKEESMKEGSRKRKQFPDGLKDEPAVKKQKLYDGEHEIRKLKAKLASTKEQLRKEQNKTKKLTSENSHLKSKILKMEKLNNEIVCAMSSSAQFWSSQFREIREETGYDEG